MVDLSHPHIVKIYDEGEHDGLPFAVMQYLSGGTLEQQRPRDHQNQPCPLPIEHLSGWLIPVAEALDLVHKMGYVHRDVKPSNILFEGKEVYLSDFGFAKVTEGGVDQFCTRFTQAGVMETPQYMAPEVHKGLKFEPAADQYSLAVSAGRIADTRRARNLGGFHASGKHG
jgi:serine/threonine-protein kinase